MGKPKKKNAFSCFLMQRQRQMKAEGILLSLNKVSEVCADEWNAMSPQERKPYEDEAKAANERRDITSHVMPANRHEPLSHVDVDVLEELDSARDHEKYLQKMAQGCVDACKSREELLDASFFLVGTNVLVRTDDRQYPPLEVAVLQYTIKDGIKYFYHTFIDPGPIPMGYARLAKEHAELHKIPIYDFIEASNDYGRIVEELHQVLQNARFTNEMTNEPTPQLVFCVFDSEETTPKQNMGVFRWLEKKYNGLRDSHFEWNIEILDLVELLFLISSREKQPILHAFGERHLTSTVYDYSLNTNCKFHDELECKDCALGLVRRWAYLLSDVLCPIFNVTLTENHVPPRRQNNVDKYFIKLQDVKPARQQTDNRYFGDSSSASFSSPPEQRTPESRPESSASQSSANLGVGRGRINRT